MPGYDTSSILMPHKVIDVHFVNTTVQLVRRVNNNYIFGLLFVLNNLREVQRLSSGSPLVFRRPAKQTMLLTTGLKNTASVKKESKSYSGRVRSNSALFCSYMSVYTD